MAEHAKPGTGLSKGRVEALSDGIFAVAMTLLILDIKVPAVADAAQLPRELLALWPKCASYAISFLMLGIYWVGQHAQFHLIRHTDRALLWINILFLMTISFVPFSTALLSSYPEQQIAVVVYGANLIAIGLILYGHWSYATRGRRLVDPELDASTVRHATRRILVGPAMFALALAVSFFSITAALAIFALTPLWYLIPGRIDQNLASAR
jgi:uncharacterized membrane protein